MRPGRPITRLFSAVGLVLLLAGVAPSAADAAGAGVSQMSQLSQPRGDVLEDGRVVVSFAAAGDLRGLLTLTLTPAGDGSYDGQWAIMVTHADTTDPETGLEPEIEEHVEGEPEHHHQDFLTIVHRGALAGSVSGAVVTFAGDGTVADVAGNLTVSQGTLEFAGATGSGQATTGSLTLLLF